MWWKRSATAGRRRVGSILLLVGVLVALTLPLPTSPASGAPLVSIVAAHADAGSVPAKLLHPAASRTAVWTSSRTRGTSLTMRFAKPTRIDGTSIRGAAQRLRVRDVRLEFSDGSVVATRTNSRGDRSLSFAPRKAGWVRLVVAGVAPGQKQVGLAGWTVRRGSSSRVSTSARFVTAAAVSSSGGTRSGTRWTASRAGAGQWLQLRWRRPVEISAIRLAGGASSAATSIRTGVLRFSDGSTVSVRSLEPRKGAPTTIAFTPRVVTSVRFTATSMAPGARAAIAQLRAYPVGVVPGVPVLPARAYATTWARASSCGDVRAKSPTAGLRLVCPTNGARIGSRFRLVVSGPAGAAVTVEAYRPRGAGGSVATVARGRIDSGGSAGLVVPTAGLLHGPTAVRVAAAGVRAPLYVQFVNPAGVQQRIPASKPARGLDLKYDETFARPLSATRTGAGAVYASGKPNSYGVDDFGAAIFAQPNGTASTASTMPGGYLRIPARALPASRSDPAGYGRTSTGGLLSSAHMGGSGFSAQYGYFEMRALGPAGPGTWSAFWLLSSGSLVGGGPTAEVDAAELYGDAPRTVFQAAHSWTDRGDTLGRYLAPAVPGGGEWALSWHTYGARVTPDGVDLYIDGVRTGHTASVVGADQPFFFLVDLALTDKWKTASVATGRRADLYVDSIRVWV